jgi:hypothetical protein
MRILFELGMAADTAVKKSRERWRAFRAQRRRRGRKSSLQKMSTLGFNAQKHKS